MSSVIARNASIQWPFMETSKLTCCSTCVLEIKNKELTTRVVLVNCIAMISVLQSLVFNTDSDWIKMSDSKDVVRIANDALGEEKSAVLGQHSQVKLSPTVIISPFTFSSFTSSLSWLKRQSANKGIIPGNRSSRNCNEYFHVYAGNLNYWMTSRSPSVWLSCL